MFICIAPNNLDKIHSEALKIHTIKNNNNNNKKKKIHLTEYGNAKS